MKIALFTLDSRIYNYGGLLQEYALFKVIERAGHDVEIIDFNLQSEANVFSYKRNIRFLTFRKIWRKIKTKLLPAKKDDSVLLIDSSAILFDDFRQQTLSFSKPCKSEEMPRVSENYDAFVCGSDQIWNPDYCIPSFFLNFVRGDKPKVIYAASLGTSNLSGVQRREYKRLLRYPSNISVREQSGKELIQPLTEKNVQLVLDPTLLLEKEEWMRLADKSPNETPYLFCYFLARNEAKMKAAEAFAAKRHLKMIFVPFKKEYSDSMAFGVAGSEGMGPKEFLSYIRFASFVLTDSFHAAVFSIIFEKPFRVFARDAGKNNMNSRIDTLLSYVRKTEYLIAPEELKNIELDEIVHYDNTHIESERGRSIEWLKAALQLADR